MSNKVYQKLTYIANKKIGDVINIDFNRSNTIRVDILDLKYSFDIIPSEAALFGGCQGYNGNIYYPIYQNNTKWKTHSGVTDTYSHKTGTIYNFAFNYDMSEYYIYKEGSLDSSIRSSYGITIGQGVPYYIFGGYNAGEIQSPALARFYGASMTLSDDTKITLVPVKRLADNVLGVLNIDSGVFYTGLTENMEFVGAVENIYYDDGGVLLPNTEEKLTQVLEEKSTDIISSNIKSGVTIFDIKGTYTDDATATVDDIISNKTAYVGGKKIIGAIPADDMINLAETITDNKSYIELEYITSDGNQYIDTGVQALSTIGAELVVKCTSSNAGAFFGSWYNQQGILFGQSEHQDENGTYNQGYAMATASQWIFSGKTSDLNWHTYKYLPNESICTIDNITISIPAIVSYENNLYLFRGNTHPEITENVSISSCKIYDNGVLIKDYIPVIRKEDNVVCMYDLVNEEFTLNAGVGIFTAGAQKQNSTLSEALDVILDEKETKIIPENIRAGIQVFDVTGTLEEGLDTSDADAVAADIAKDRTAYIKGQKVTGTLQVNPSNSKRMFWASKTTTTAGTDSIYMLSRFTADEGFRSGAEIQMVEDNATVASVIGLTADKILEGNTILGIDGTASIEFDASDATATASDIRKGTSAYGSEGTLIEGTLVPLSTTDATAVAADILTGKTAYMNDKKVTGTMKNYGAQTLEPEGDSTKTTTFNGYVESVSIPSISECLNEAIPVGIKDYKYADITSYNEYTMSVSAIRGCRVIAIVTAFIIPTYSDGWNLIDKQVVVTDNGNVTTMTMFIFEKIAESTTESFTVVGGAQNAKSMTMYSYDSSAYPNILYSFGSNGISTQRVDLPIEIKSGDYIVVGTYNKSAPSLGGISASVDGTSNLLRVFRITSNAAANSGYVYISTTDFVSVMIYRFDEILPLASENIKAGVKIGGVDGTFTTDANALESEIVADRIAYVNGQKVIGTMTDHGDIEITPSDIDQNIESGYVNSASIKAVDITSLYEYENCLELADAILTSSELTTYRQLDYIKFTGIQYLDLGIPLWSSNNWKVKTVVNFDYWYSYQHLLSISDADSKHETWVDGSGLYYLRLAEGNKQAVETLTAKTTYELVNEMKDGICNTYIDGVLKNTTEFGAFTSDLNLRFGGRASGRFIGTLYSIELYQDDVLVGNLIPAMKKDGDIPCMYDTIRDVFITNAQADGGNFIAGSLTREE